MHRSEKMINIYDLVSVDSFEHGLEVLNSLNELIRYHQGQMNSIAILEYSIIIEYSELTGFVIKAVSDHKIEERTIAALTSSAIGIAMKHAQLAQAALYQ